MSVINVVVGGQYGSEAKGHVTGWLAKSKHVGAVVRIAGPNAGHTAYDDQGRPWALRQIPCAAVTNLTAKLIIAAGSEIDTGVLINEIKRLEDGGIPITDRLFIDPEATVIENRHQDIEHDTQLTDRVGSTGKGIGAARADRIMRKAAVWRDLAHGEGPYLDRLNMAPAAPALVYAMNQGLDIVIEGTQGYGLGLHAGYYPFCTSSDCRAIDFLSMAGVSPWGHLKDGAPPELRIWPVFRTYPIRVAGNSGPMHRELDWAELGERTDGYVKPERTTVTQKIRRIGEWDALLAHRAMVANGHPSMSLFPVLTFVDYWFPELANVSDRETLDRHDDLWASVQSVEGDLGFGPGAPARLAAFTTGPDTLVSLL